MPRPPLVQRTLAFELARATRDLRQAHGWTQRRLAAAASSSQSTVSRIERGELGRVPLAHAARILDALGARVTLTIEAPLLSDRRRQREPVHARTVGYVAKRLERQGWQTATEVEIDGGKGWIDVLACRGTSRRLLVIEIKTEIDDVGRILRTLHWYERRAVPTARQLGWRAVVPVPVLLVIASLRNDARIRFNKELLGHALPGTAHDLEWLLADEGESRRGYLAMVDPARRAKRWLMLTVPDGRRTAPPYVDYADAARQLHNTRPTAAGPSPRPAIPQGLRSRGFSHTSMSKSANAGATRARLTSI